MKRKIVISSLIVLLGIPSAITLAQSNGTIYQMNPWKVSGTTITPVVNTNSIKGSFFTATSTTIASTFPYASTTAVSASGLTSDRIAYTGTNGLLQTNDVLQFSGTALTISYGAPSGAINIGADPNGTTRTPNTRHLGVMAAPNYANSANIELLSSDSTGATTNMVNFGGRVGGGSTAATEMYFNTNPLVTLSGGKTRFYIDRDGQVAVNKSSSMTSAFEVNMAIESTAKTAGYDLVKFTNVATSSTANAVKSGLNISSTGTWNGTGASNIGLYVSSVTGGTNNYDAIFNGGGNVGIGTSSPTSKLEVYDTLANVPTFRIGLTNAQAIIQNSVIGQIAFSSYDDSVGSIRQDSGYIKSIAEGCDSGVPCRWDGTESHEIAGLSFFTQSARSTLNEAVRISGSGKVGIGTTSPYASLSVAGNGVFNQDVRANYFTSTSTTIASTFPYASTTAITSSGSAYFATTGGNVGIGTSSPAYPLEVLSSLGVTSAGASNSSFIVATGDNAAKWSFTTNFGTGLFSMYNFLTNKTPLNVATTAPNNSLNLNTASVSSVNPFLSSNGSSAGTNYGINGMTSYFTGQNEIVGGSGTLTFQTYNNSWLNRMTIINSGDVGIGTTTPNNNLQVNNPTATSTISLTVMNGGTRNTVLGGRIILQDVAGGTCTEITTQSGSVNSKAVACP